MGGGEGGFCSPMVLVPFCCSTKGLARGHASPCKLCQVRHQGCSSSVAILLVEERIVCAIVAAQTATPVSVRIDSRCPAPLVDNRAG